LALIFLTATGSALIFGTSLALGAFIAGMVVGRTHVRHQATSQALPIQDVFFVIFFLSVGMLFNPAAIIKYPLMFLGILGIILIIKPVVACFITLGYRYPLKVAVTVAFALAQIGEFSFILSEEAMKYKILPDAGYDLIVACAIVSITLNPLLFKALDPLFSYLGISKSVMFVISPLSKSPSPTRAIIVGYGPIGHSVMQTLEKLGFITIVIDLNVDTITQLIAEQRQAVYGDASQGIILETAQIKTSSLLVITIPDAAAARKIVEMARQLNPEIELLVRSRFLHDRSYLAEPGIELICCEKESMQAFEQALNKLAKARFQNV
jgi:monovalent cation:H+ antiporter-2, CPA2 family